ncbi:MAG: sel1 repeat family protein [Alteromonadales bacterium]|nr:sel1 repeat family protein [Alteromonadales bacterium]
MSTLQNTPQTDLMDEIRPNVRWGWLVYVILCNSLCIWIFFTLLDTRNYLFSWFELFFTMTISVGGVLYALNRRFLQKWLWKVVFWLLVLHCLLFSFAALNTSLLLFLFVGVYFVPNTYLIFKYAHSGKIIWENLSQTSLSNKNATLKKLGRLLTIAITIIVIIASFHSIFKSYDSQNSLEAQHKTLLRVLYERGLMYQEGKGVPQDNMQAVSLYRKAAEQGHIRAQSALASIYANGEGVKQDDKQAAMWFKKAAAQGDAYSQYRLGAIYAYGKGVTQDDKQAANWYRKAAEQGDQHSQFQLGLILQDDIESEKWFMKAAKQGSVKAQFFLGLMYKTGKGGVQDDKQAAMWFQKAAEQGYADAQYELGVIYYAAKGGPKNHKQAITWLQKATEQGNTMAQKMLSRIEKSTDPDRLVAIVDMLTVTKQWLTTECKKKGYVPITGLSVSCKGSFKELSSCLENYNENSSRNMSCSELDSQISTCEANILKIAPKESNSKESQLLTVQFIECIIK